jgi:IPT/TIG domain
VATPLAFSIIQVNPATLKEETVLSTVTFTGDDASTPRLTWRTDDLADITTPASF